MIRPSLINIYVYENISQIICEIYMPKLYVNYQIINPLKYLIINLNSISLTETNVKTLFLLINVNHPIKHIHFFFNIQPIL